MGRRRVDRRRALAGQKDALKVKRFIERARAAAPQPYLGPDELPYDWSDE